MLIGDLALRTGLSIDTLRWYEKIGLLPKPTRDRGGRRVYDEAILVWIDFLARLKATGMPVAAMRDYARLRAAGPSTTTARRCLLEDHRARVAAEIAALAAGLTALDAKIDIYRAVEAEDASRAEPKDPTR